MFNPTELTIDFINALFDVDLAKQVDFYDEDLRNIEASQHAPSAPLRKAFLLKLLNDVEQYGLTAQCRYFASDIELFIFNSENNLLTMTLDDLDKLKVENATITHIYISDDKTALYRNMKNVNLDFLLKHDFKCNSSYTPRFERDYRPFDLKKGFEFELSWFSKWIEASNKAETENARIMRKFNKMRKIAELKNEKKETIAK